MRWQQHHQHKLEIGEIHIVINQRKTEGNYSDGWHLQQNDKVTSHDGNSELCTNGEIYWEENWREISIHFRIVNKCNL